jgi:hypothetical protein
MFLSYGQERRYDAELADAVTDDLELAPSWRTSKEETGEG